MTDHDEKAPHGRNAYGEPLCERGQPDGIGCERCWLRQERRRETDALREAEARGAEMEREAIVGWLRERDVWRRSVRTADEIARLAHHPAPAPAIDDDPPVTCDACRSREPGKHRFKCPTLGGGQIVLGVDRASEDAGTTDESAVGERNGER